jgi:hypothetical protein
MDETKRTNLAVSFPDVQLTPEQELKLKNALKSAVVTILPKLKEGQVNVEYKVG